MDAAAATADSSTGQLGSWARVAFHAARCDARGDGGTEHSRAVHEPHRDHLCEWLLYIGFNSGRFPQGKPAATESR